MAYHQVFSHGVYCKYKARLFSKATLCIAISFLICVTVPAIISYKTEGFWLKFSFYKEQPEVKFKYQFLVELQLSGGTFITYSTFNNYNNLFADSLRIPVVKCRENDENRDGRNDYLDFSLEIPMEDKEKVSDVKLFLVFDYKLWKYSKFQMESIAYISSSSILPATSFHSIGDLKFMQRIPLYHKGIDLRFNNTIFDASSMRSKDYDYFTILSNYHTRNVSTYYSNSYDIWKFTYAVNAPFILKSTIRYPEETIQYIPGFIQILKWAWIQYLSLFLIFIFLFYNVNILIFNNQLISTIVNMPWDNLKKNS